MNELKKELEFREKQLKTMVHEYERLAKYADDLGHKIKDLQEDNQGYAQINQIVSAYVVALLRERLLQVPETGEEDMRAIRIPREKISRLIASYSVRAVVDGSDYLISVEEIEQTEEGEIEEVHADD